MWVIKHMYAIVSFVFVEDTFASINKLLVILIILIPCTQCFRSSCNIANSSNNSWNLYTFICL